MDLGNHEFFTGTNFELCFNQKLCSASIYLSFEEVIEVCEKYNIEAEIRLNSKNAEGAKALNINPFDSMWIEPNYEFYTFVTIEFFSQDITLFVNNGPDEEKWQDYWKINHSEATLQTLKYFLEASQEWLVPKKRLSFKIFSDEEVGELVKKKFVRSEIKVIADKKNKKSGDIFIEYALNGQASGIKATLSKWHAFIVEDIIIILSTKKLINFMEQYFNTSRDVVGGVCNNKKGLLIPFKELIDMSPNQYKD